MNKDCVRSGTGFLKVVSASTLLCVFFACERTAHAADSGFDELRFGASTSVSGGHESGLSPSLTVFFDPFSETQAKGWRETILEPRLYLGGSIGADQAASQVYGGVSFDVDITEKIFLEFGFGGTVHDGDLGDDGSNGPKLGCRMLFREQASAGYRFDDNWQFMATFEHSSHANLCDGPNDGITQAGLAIGYRF